MGGGGGEEARSVSFKTQEVSSFVLSCARKTWGGNLSGARGPTL